MVHPSVKVLALGGPIVLGESNLLKDSATIVNPSVSSHQYTVHTVHVTDTHAHCMHV